MCRHDLIGFPYMFGGRLMPFELSIEAIATNVTVIGLMI